MRSAGFNSPSFLVGWNNVLQINGLLIRSKCPIIGFFRLLIEYLPENCECRLPSKYRLLFIDLEFISDLFLFSNI